MFIKKSKYSSPVMCFIGPCNCGCALNRAIRPHKLVRIHTSRFTSLKNTFHKILPFPCLLPTSWLPQNVFTEEVVRTL